MDTIKAVSHQLKQEVPDLVQSRQILASPDHRRVGSCGLLIGLSTAVAYRMNLLAEQKVSPATLSRLIEAVWETMSKPVGGVLTSPVKRQYLVAFLQAFFRDLPNSAKQGGIPRGLVELLGPAAFGLTTRTARGSRLALAGWSDDDAA